MGILCEETIWLLFVYFGCLVHRDRWTCLGSMATAERHFMTMYKKTFYEHDAISLFREISYSPLVGLAVGVAEIARVFYSGPKQLAFIY